MNTLLLTELRNLEKRIERMLRDLKQEMDADPRSRIIDIELEFQAFLNETKGAKGVRTTEKAMSKIDDLYREKQRQEERAKLWNHNDLTNDWIQWSQALDDLKRLLWNVKEAA